MRPLRFVVNITLDGCCDHTAVVPDPAMHQHHTANLARASAMLFGRVTYGMMEEAWRPVAEGARPEWIEPWMVPFAKTIDAMPKYVASTTLTHVAWNTQLLRGDLREEVLRIKASEGGEVLVSGIQLGMALSRMALIDEYEFVVHPRIAGRGPTIFDGLEPPLDLELVSHERMGAGSLVLRYRPAG